MHHLLGSISGVLWGYLLGRFLGSPFWVVVSLGVAFSISHFKSFHVISILATFVAGFRVLRPRRVCTCNLGPGSKLLKFALTTSTPGRWSIPPTVCPNWAPFWNPFWDNLCYTFGDKFWFTFGTPLGITFDVNTRETKAFSDFGDKGLYHFA